ncbi:MAG: ABC transporter permease [Spirochaetaceae bacterium]|nr:ABC transporter permease [Spirochaetaceae bacterium]
MRMRTPFVFKSVFRRMGRYGFLVAMIAFGIAMVTMVQSVTVGMRENVVAGSARYLGGAYVVIARRDHGYAVNRVEAVAAVKKAVAEAGLKPSLVVEREVAAENGQTLYFNGEAFELRRITGVDTKNEAPVFARLGFDEGSPAGLSGTKGILVSRQVARRLGLRVGDGLTLRLSNHKGFLTSAELVVRGIFSDASIFGYYNAYVDIALLRELLGGDADQAVAMGFYFKDRADSRERAAELNAAISAAGLPVFPKLENRGDLDALWNESWQGVRYGILPVEHSVDARVMDIIEAVELASYLFLAMILAIVLVGMRNTTHIMTRRRFKEIGTIRALGMSEAGARRLVLGEALIVASIGFALGVAAAFCTLLIVSAIPFDWSAGFDIFLNKGRLTFSLSAFFLAINYGALALMTVLGALPAASQAARIPPAAAMSTNE